jgi:predicted membrane protein
MEGQVQKDNTRLIIALVIIGIGFIWLLQKASTAFHISIPWFTHHLFTIRPIFMNLGKIIFSWQLILILVGVVLLAGRRSSGIVLIILGSLLLIQKLLAFPHHTITFLIPLILIAVGVTLIIKAYRR